MRLTSLLPRPQDVAIFLPDGEPTGITIRVVSRDSRAFREVAKKYGETFISGNKVSVDEAELANNELLASVIIGWSGLDGDDDKPLPFSPVEALKLVSNPELAFVREQVEAFVANRLNFFRGAGQGKGAADSESSPGGEA